MVVCMVSVTFMVFFFPLRKLAREWGYAGYWNGESEGSECVWGVNIMRNRNKTHKRGPTWVVEWGCTTWSLALAMWWPCLCVHSIVYSIICFSHHCVGPLICTSSLLSCTSSWEKFSITQTLNHLDDAFLSVASTVPTVGHFNKQLGCNLKTKSALVHFLPNLCFPYALLHEIIKLILLGRSVRE